MSGPAVPAAAAAAAGAVSELAAPPAGPSRTPCAASVAGDGVVPYPTDTAALPVTDALYERPETSLTVLAPNDGVANAYSDPFPGSLGGRYLLFYNNSRVTLTGRGYVTMRWEYAYFNRGGVITPAIAPAVTATPGSFVKKVAGAVRFMPDPDLDGVPGQTGLWRPGAQNFTPITISGPAAAAPTGWQNEYYYIDGTVTFANRESGLDYNLSLTPVTGAQVRADVANTRVGANVNVQRPALLLDPYDGSSKPSSPTQLSATVVSDSRVALTWADCATTEKGYLVEMSYAGDFGDAGRTKRYALGELYALAGSYPAGTRGATIATLLPATQYRLRVKAYDAAGDSAYSDIVDFKTPAASPLTPPYVQSDVSTTALATAGTASVSDGNVALRGASRDIFGTADSFTFVHRPMTGDGTFTARVVGMSYTARSAKAGVMMRDGLAPQAAYAMAAYQPAGGVGGQRRQAFGGTTALEGSDRASDGKPWWIRVIRRGNIFTMQSSPDAVTWTTLSNRPFTMGATIEVGLVAASLSDRVGTVTYDNVSLAQP